MIDHVFAFHAYSEIQIAAMALGGMIVGVALLSYYVVAPEFERHLHKADGLEPQGRYSSPQPYYSTTPTGHKHRTLIKKRHSISSSRVKDDLALTSLSDDDNVWVDSDVLQSYAMFPPTSEPCRRKVMYKLSKRRKSESDANRAEKLRKRVMLRTLEEEIQGAIKESNAAENHGKKMRNVTKSSIEEKLSEARVQEVQSHPVHCTDEFRALTTTSQTESIVEALAMVHDVISCYLSGEHRDLNKVSVFCNSLLEYDGLNLLRTLEQSEDTRVRKLSTAVIEKAVPCIWH